MVFPSQYRLFPLCRAMAVLALAGAAAAGLSACPASSTLAGQPRMTVIAHRAGTADAPENTLEAIRAALSHNVDMIWLSVQLSRDGVPVLYRPAKLDALTNGDDRPVAGLTLAELQRLNAGWRFAVPTADGGTQYPYRDAPVRIPTLAQALAAIPPTVPVILDMKAVPAAPQAAAVAAVLREHTAWQRVYLYSTDAAYQQAFAAWPEARLFESRDATRDRLVGVALARQCDRLPAAGTWAGFEVRRKVEVVETITLGEGRSPVHALLWTPASVACFRKGGNVRLVAFGVNDAAALREAERLGMDAVMVDSPRAMMPLRASGPAN